ncbi:2-polyprenyl-6-methoxyphenol hydroxylase-like FAD-dependent oxidoreductase [Nocardia transvalensis]|uniref:2-polyprenyl-6-methoxyphenol hydroxylase-like FAD-dependent oxidoreductase n=1 Tax=Nocardia transvalensis TaxID=37333 RepID=A0A7W9PKT7_9NOCA|nr:NAD(P)/FAD-dependent oxidoreductase [Nocardia transvalensis]MBB5918056.1 2-polyprenyl-6-methoxyphenol hydroxylase-like FAD-dependent oxidoreductase [Nocardia transvalensis]
MSHTPRILIAGAGIGGLALAQALRHGGLDVAVYEQDPTPRTRNQGYRLHIDANGNAALRACLPPEVFDLVRETSGVNDDVLGMYTHRLEQVMSQHFPDLTDDEITCVDRNTFRRGLLAGLDDVVRFGRTLAGYQVTESGRVRVHFAEGGEDEGDLLVGADGVGSAVRRQLLPHATVRDLGIRCIYGRMALTPETEALYPAAIRRGFNWISDDTGYGAGFAPVRFRSRPEGATDYTMVTLLARPERLGLPDDELFTRSPEDLWKHTVAATADWHPDLREIFTHADPGTFFPIALRAGRRIPAWTPGPVTLLGDAIHTMPPTGGVGANTALQDAATLADELLTRGEKPLIDAIAAYETVMLPRGFDTIDASLQMADQLFGTAD